MEDRALTELLAIEEIRQLKARYFRLMDLKKWDEMRSVFADDVSCDFRGAGTDPVSGFNAVPGATEAVLRGVDDVVGSLRAGLTGITTVHAGHDPEIMIISPITAQAVWGMSDIMRFSPGAAYASLRGYGHYEETYDKTSGAWKIMALKLTRLFVEVVPA